MNSTLHGIIKQSKSKIYRMQKKRFSLYGLCLLAHWRSPKSLIHKMIYAMWRYRIYQKSRATFVNWWRNVNDELEDNGGGAAAKKRFVVYGLWRWRIRRLSRSPVFIGSARRRRWRMNKKSLPNSKNWWRNLHSIGCDGCDGDDMEGVVGCDGWVVDYHAPHSSHNMVDTIPPTCNNT